MDDKKDKFSTIENIKQFSVLNDESKDSLYQICFSMADSLKEVYSSLESIDSIKTIANQVQSIVSEYVKLTSEIKAPTLAVETLLNSVADITSYYSNINFSYLAETLQESFARSDYYSSIKAINKALSESYVDSADIYYFKKSKILFDDNKDIVIPSGMITSLNEINNYSVERIKTNRTINYDTKNIVFVNEKEVNSKASSKDMNVICSTMFLLEKSQEELFTEEELMNFLTVLEERYGTAIKTKTGVKIYRFVENLKQSTIDFDHQEYYHARARENDSVPYTSSQMLIPPTGLSNPGRYNRAGSSHYYFTDTIEGAKSEIGKHNPNRTIQIAKIKPISNIRMIDLSSDVAQIKTLLRHIRFSKDECDIPRAYLLPNYISDCCKECGIEGIKYRGSKVYSNYVTWSSRYFDFMNMIV